MINLPEILIILVIVLIVFGIGKVGNIGSHLGKAKNEFKKGLDGESERLDDGREVIDITPAGDDEREPDFKPKPGTRQSPVEDAEIETSA